MEQFLSKHAGDVTGALSGFERRVFRGALRMLAHRGGMLHDLHAVRMLLKDFAGHAEALTRRLRDASEELAKRTLRPIVHLPSSATNKEDKAREIARADGIEQGLIRILTAVESCLSYEIVRDRNAKTIELEPRHRKCLHLYHYQEHPSFGFMHARINRHRGVCPCCRKRIAAPPPEGFDPGSPFGPGLCALILHLHVTQAIGFERLSRLLAEVFGLTISEGAIANILARAEAPLLAAAVPIAAAATVIATGRLHGTTAMAAIRAALAGQAVVPTG